MLRSKLVIQWMAITAAASLVAIFDDGWLVRLTALEPDRVWHGQVWRLVTWPLVELGPMSLVFTIVCIYKFAGELAPRWGDRRLRRFVFELVIAGGVISSIGALVSDYAWNMARTGGYAMCDALLIAWARQYPMERLRFYGFLELNGQKLVIFVAGVTVLLALSTNVFVMMPELVACVGAALYPRAWLAR